MSIDRTSERLPTARAAMRQAVERAQLGEWDGARVWIDIARELRLGEASPARPLPRPLDTVAPEQVRHLGDDSLLPVCGATTAEDPRGALVTFRAVDSNCPACLSVDRLPDNLAAYAGEPATMRIDRVAVPAPEPAYRSADTAVIPVADGDEYPSPRCAYCDYSLVWFAPGPGPDIDAMPYWVHAATGQRVCSVPAIDQPHTFATPRGDDRG